MKEEKKEKKYIVRNFIFGKSRKTCTARRRVDEFINKRQYTLFSSTYKVRKRTLSRLCLIKIQLRSVMYFFGRNGFSCNAIIARFQTERRYFRTTTPHVVFDNSARIVVFGRDGVHQRFRKRDVVHAKIFCPR